jgi:hypothetical protein
MNCPNEFIQTQFADGELPEREAAEFVMHLKFCAACRERVAALKAENQLIAESLQGIDSWELGREFESPGIRGIALFAAVFSAAAVLLRLVMDLMLAIEAPAGLDWISPLNLSGLLNWLANGIGFYIERGLPMISSLVDQTGATILILGVLGMLAAVARKTKGIAAMVSLTAVMFAFVMPGYAIDYRKAEKWGSISVSPGETIDDTLVAFGDSVKIRGTVTGDLIALARKIDIQGTVQGNVICLAQTLDMTGKVEGDVFAGGQFVQISGAIDKNFWGAGLNNLLLATNGKVQHNATIFGSNINIDGEVGRDLAATGGYLDIGGAIGRDVRYSGTRILIQAPAKIGKSLYAYVQSEKDAHIDSKVIIGGERKIELLKSENKYLSFRFYITWILYIVAFFLAGMFLIGLIPKAGQFSFSSVRALLASGGIGIFIYIILPMVAAFFVITIMKTPSLLIGLVVSASWLIGILLGPIIVASYIGRAIIRKQDAKMSSTALSLIVGLFIIAIAVNLPYIGQILLLLLMIVGLGALAIVIYRTWELRWRTEKISA